MLTEQCCDTLQISTIGIARICPMQVTSEVIISTFPIGGGVHDGGPDASEPPVASGLQGNLESTVNLTCQEV